MSLLLNGKFVGQRTTGVQRFARELVIALDALLGTPEFAFADGAFRLAVPDASADAVPRLERIGVLRVPGIAGHRWEQFALPLAARGSVLVNLSGGFPALKTGQVCVLHDAAVFDQPQAYRAAFIAWYRTLFRLQARNSRLLLTISEFSRARLAANLGIDAARLRVMPCGGDHILRPAADDAVLRRLGLAPQAYLLAVGSANPTKNFPALVQAFRSLPADCGVRLVIVGGINSAVFAGGAVGTVVSDERLTLAGSVSDGELRALYSHALAFVFPSTYEGFGIPPLEAMACGCPVLASTAPAVVETCGDAALYFDPLDVPAIAGALERAIRDSELRATLSRAGARRAARFTWEHAARRLLEHLAAAGLVEDKIS